MSKLNQSGFSQVIIVLLLAVGLGVGVFAVQHPTFFTPHAQELPIQIFNPQPSTEPFCSTHLIYFSVTTPCTDVYDGFRAAQYACGSGENPKELPSVANGGGTGATSTAQPQQACLSLQDWVSMAQSKCSSQCVRPPQTPTPTPSILGQCNTNSDCGSGEICIPAECNPGTFCEPGSPNYNPKQCEQFQINCSKRYCVPASPPVFPSNFPSSTPTLPSKIYLKNSKFLEYILQKL